MRYASPRPGDEPLVGLSSSRCPVWPCRCLKSPFLSDDQVFRWFSCAHEHSMRFPPVVDDPNKRETPQPRIYTHVDACLYMCVSTYTRVPACRPAEPSALAPPTSQFGPNPPNVGGGRPARRPLLSLLSPTQPVSFPALSLLSVSLPPNAPRRPRWQPPPDNVAFLLQILNTCCQTALSRRDMCSLLPGSSVCALAEVCIPSPAPLTPPPHSPTSPRLVVPVPRCCLCRVPACRAVTGAAVPHGDGIAHPCPAGRAVRSVWTRYIWTRRSPACARAYIGIVSENPRQTDRQTDAPGVGGTSEITQFQPPAIVRDAIH